MTQQDYRRARQPPSSTDLVSEIDDKEGTSPMVSTLSGVEVELHRTEIEHAQNRLALFHGSRVPGVSAEGESAHGD